MTWMLMIFFVFFLNDTPPTEIYPLPLHDALPIWAIAACREKKRRNEGGGEARQRHRGGPRSEEHTSELQSRLHLACRLLLVNISHQDCALLQIRRAVRATRLRAAQRRP